METPQTLSGQSLLERRYRVFALGILLLYATGLTKEIGEPWVGLHDWNGAFFSQLARNCIRYPFEIHHGMPVVAMGAAAPAASERSIYATHPPGLVWLVASAFSIFGESEAIARCVPIIASLGSLGLLLHLWRPAMGRRMALLAGLFYACMPMSVYFGRMVDHEALGLFFMLSAGAMHVRLRNYQESDGGRGSSAVITALLSLLLISGCWIGWAGCLFAAIYCLIASKHLFRTGRRIDTGRRGAAIAIGCVAGSAVLLAYYLVHAGLAGKWGDLASVFLSRATNERGDAPRPTLAIEGSVWRHTMENLTWPLMILAIIGLAGAVLEFRHRIVSRNWASTGKSPGPSEQASRSMLGLVTFTGVVWLAVFPRQYLFHAYWPFFLGPAVAMLAAQSIGMMSKHVHATSRAMSLAALGAIVVATSMLEVRGQWHYFGREERVLSAHVRAWVAISEMTAPKDRIATFGDPTWVERRGDYVFRNIVPPQFAYYADRAFTVERDLAKVVELAGNHALFVIPVADAVKNGGSLRPLRERFSEQLVEETLVIFDLRTHRNASLPSNSQPESQAIR